MLEERRHLYVYKELSTATVAIRKENWEKVKGLREQGKYTILVYVKIYSWDKI